MNKIFKVIWSKSKQCYVVVSELAKNTTGKKKIVVASILVALSASQAIFPMEVEASKAHIINSTSNSGVALAPGDGTAEANANNAIAIGRAKANKSGAIAIGSHAETTANNAISLGWNALGSGDSSIAIGAAVTQNGVDIGVKSSGAYSLAAVSLSEASGEKSIAVGYSAKAKGEASISIGKDSKTEDQNAIAIGIDSYAKTMDSIAIGNTAKATGLVSTALGARAEALGTSAVAVGINAKAKKDQATALGFNAQANEENSLALGYGATSSKASGVALGYLSTADTAAGVAGYNANTGRSDTYNALSGTALTSTLGAVSVGNSSNTRQITGVAAGTADTDAVNVAQLKSINLAFTGNSGSGDVNLSKSKLAVEGGTNSFITTTAANKKLEINTTQGTLKNTSGTVSVNGANGLAVAQNVADVINQANADQTIKYKANGTGNNSVKLSDGLNFTNGTTTTATVGANGQVSFDLNTATQKSITDSAAAVARSISLGGDTGTTTAKSLSSANVNFGIKSGSPTYLTTVANGNDVTLTINEQAIKNAAKDASSFKVKANSTTAEDVKGGDTIAFNNGDNIAITQTGKTFKIATAPNVKFDTAIIGTNTTIGSTGVSTNKVTVGNISIDGTGGINAGGKAITNVGTGRVSNSSTDDGNVANIGDVKAIANDAVANLSTSLGVTDGTNSGTVNLKNQSLKVVGTGVAKATVNGQTITVDVAKGTLTNNTTTGALTGTAGVVDANDMATAVNTAITKAVDTATGTQKLDVSAGGTDSSVNLKTQKLTVAGTGAATASLTGQTITVNVAEGTLTSNATDGQATATAGVAKAVDVAAAINTANTVLGNKITAATQSLSTLGDNKFKLTADSTSTTGQALNQSGGLSFKIAGDSNFISTSAAGDTVTVSVKQGVFGSNADGTAKSTTNGVATTDNVANIVNTTVSNAVNNVTSNQNLKIGGDTTAANSAVNLKNDTLSVKGDNKYISTAASGNDITLTVNEQAIKTAAKDAATFKVKANSEPEQEVKGGETVAFNDGDNIKITQTGKTFSIATAKNVTFDTATIGTNTTIGSTGITTNKVTVGGISIDGTSGINAGGKTITNVGTGRVSNSSTDDGNVANIGDVKAIANDAVSNLSTSLGVTDGTNSGTVNLKNQSLKVVGTGVAKATVNGQTITVDVAKGTLTNNTTTGALTGTAGVVDANDMVTAVNTAITKAVDTATGTQKLDISAGGTDSSVNLKTQKLTVAGTGAATASLTGQTITVNVAEGTFTNKSDGTTSATAGVAKATDVAAAINNTNTVLNQKIADATTSLGTLGNNTFTLKADSTDTTAQNLNKSGGL
ncbi:ESPR-type extended signal peptide-containing protein, partial [Veillonella atypica]|uniref:ESPR-type extended signal peptide-containing protein n=1 Tax=Veillonella atypica TaxID=39777 RepID=UPI003AF113D6